MYRFMGTTYAWAGTGRSMAHRMDFLYALYDALVRGKGDRSIFRWIYSSPSEK
jgi:hypothetical protein